MKLIAIDMDGTLLDNNSEISKENIDAIKEIQKLDDFIVYICTGRDITNVKEYLKKYDLDIIAIGLNGAIGYRGEEKLFDYGFDYDSLLNIVGTLKDYPFKLYTANNRYNTKNYLKQFEDVHNKYRNKENDYEFERELKYENTLPSKEVEDVKEIEDKVSKIYLFIPNQEEKKRLMGILSNIDGVTATESDSVNIEIIPSNVNKGFVFDHIKDLYKFDEVTKIAIGDSMNDHHMFEEADYGFAVENAHPEIKKLATHHVASNVNNGVKYALEIIKEL